MLPLSRVPVSAVKYTGLPSDARRGFLRAELLVNNARTVVCSVHLDSGKRSAPLRERQLGRIFRALDADSDAVVLGDFNMRDRENHLIERPFRDVWPTLRPGEDGYTEDTSINDMRYDNTGKNRHVRFDRVLLKGQQWRPESITLLGTEPISPEHPRVFPSDHFGVRCLLSARPPADP
ncbi:endonuclease/exonuclease/phosphatase family protein [Mycolicibacterium iranicum]|uniref:Endonuclease/exonuclease/phosphatase family protein n=1 Tax=Mycolicibacterium iranicum TaxID=912594 RepID=A0ABT4HC10_MYCIR|nr:endonuclease/exonuclease/phosphatase family protein [Mycolicibacterium iranicum]